LSVVLWLYLAVAVPYTAFLILYAVVSRPKTAIGRSLLLSKAVIVALAWNAVLSLALGDYPGRDLVRVFAVGGAIVAGWWQLTLLLIEQRRDRGCAEDKETVS
jgi:hypothetical protein